MKFLLKKERNKLLQLAILFYIVCIIGIVFFVYDPHFDFMTQQQLDDIAITVDTSEIIDSEIDPFFDIQPVYIK